VSNTPVARDDQRLAAFLAAGQSSAVVDPQQATLDIVSRILRSDSVEDVLKRQEAIHARDVLGEPLHVVGIRRQESSVGESGPDFYMLIDCVTPDGEPYSVTCGAVNVMAQLHKLEELGAFPLMLTLVEVDKPTKTGYKPMWAEACNVDPAKAYDPMAKSADF